VLVRKDPAAQACPFLNERDELDQERGEFLQPDAYGAGAEAQIGALDQLQRAMRGER
jgi:hypothetical protein